MREVTKLLNVNVEVVNGSDGWCKESKLICIYSFHHVSSNYVPYLMAKRTRQETVTSCMFHFIFFHDTEVLTE